MPATFRTVASGLVTRLDTQMAYLNTCRQYAGEIDDVESAVLVCDQAPACFIVFEGMVPQTADESFDERTFLARYGVVVVAKTMGGALDKAESATYSAHKIIEDVLAYGVDNNLGITGYEGLTPGAVRRVKITAAAAIYVVELLGYVSLTA